MSFISYEKWVCAVAYENNFYSRSFSGQYISTQTNALTTNTHNSGDGRNSATNKTQPISLSIRFSSCCMAVYIRLLQYSIILAIIPRNSHYVMTWVCVCVYVSIAHKYICVKKICVQIVYFVLYHCYCYFDARWSEREWANVWFLFYVFTTSFGRNKRCVLVKWSTAPLTLP